MSRPSWSRIAATAAAAAGVGVAAVVVGHAARLIAYPYDWSPDEGLQFDYARRLFQSPGSLYHKSVAPFPACYGPGLPLLLAPIVALFANPLPAARLLTLLWTAASAAAVYVLVRREAGRALAAVSAALGLLPMSVSHWHLLVRVDGAMHAFWILAALPLVPRRLEKGADRLSAARIGCGTALLFFAALCKPTAILVGAPLVLGWLLVDFRSGAALIATLASLGAVWVAGMQWLTDGAYLWSMLMWQGHRLIPGQALSIATYYFSHTAGLWMFVGAGLVSCAVRAGRPFADGAWLLLLGGLLAAPLAEKGGASEVYLLPLGAAGAVLGGRSFGSGRHAAAGAALATAVAILLLARHPARLPTPRDEATARTFYGYVLARSSGAGRPLLALMPEWAYFLAGQPALVQGSALPYMVESKLPGTETLLARVEAGEYGVITTFPEVWPWTEEWKRALRERYTLAGECHLGYYYGTLYAQLLLVPRGEPPGFDPPDGARCSRQR